jgi:hypothetical protein
VMEYCAISIRAKIMNPQIMPTRTAGYLEE